MDEGTVGFLIIDDSLGKKDKSTKKIEGLDYHHSHSDGKTVWSHCVVTSHYKISDYSLPQNFKLYLRKQFFGNKAKKYFKNKQELALQLIDCLLYTSRVVAAMADDYAMVLPGRALYRRETALGRLVVYCPDAYVL